MGNFQLDFKEAVLKLNKRKAFEVFYTFENLHPEMDFFSKIAMPVLKDIGEGWSNGDVALAQVYMSGTICEALIEEKYGMDNHYKEDASKIAAVTLDDFHPLGKKLLISVLRAYEIRVVDLGHDLSIHEIVDRLEALDIELLLVSVLMLPSALKVKELKDAIVERSLKTKIMVGGSPFRLDKTLWQEVSADYCGEAPMDAVHLIKEMRGGV